LGLIILMGQVRKENRRGYWSTDPFFLTLWVGTILKPLGKTGILVRTASKHRNQGSYSNLACVWIFCTEI
jgi:hypothetical protein